MAILIDPRSQLIYSQGVRSQPHMAAALSWPPPWADIGTAESSKTPTQGSRYLIQFSKQVPKAIIDSVFEPKAFGPSGAPVAPVLGDVVTGPKPSGSKD